MHKRVLWMVGLIALGACAGSCASTQANQAATPSDLARARYNAGMAELEAGNYTESIQEFSQVVRSPGYVKYGALARLRIADALFLQEKYDAAIENYRVFLQQFTGNPNAGYARFRIGHALYEKIPAVWFLSPPAHEREQRHVRAAGQALRRFVSLYPTNRMTGRAQELLDSCDRILYEHELYVAEFYREREKPAGVVLRLERAFQNYPDLAGTEDNFMMLAQAHAQTGRLGRAKLIYEAYMERFPGGEYRDQAQSSLDAIQTVE